MSPTLTMISVANSVATYLHMTYKVLVMSATIKKLKKFDDMHIAKCNHILFQRCKPFIYSVFNVLIFQADQTLKGQSTKNQDPIGGGKARITSIQQLWTRTDFNFPQVIRNIAISPFEPLCIAKNLHGRHKSSANTGLMHESKIMDK